MARISLLLFGSLILWFSSLEAQPLDPQLRDRIGIDQNLGGQIPLDLTFVDEEGQSVQLSQLFGDKPVILSLVYYECPMLCTQVLNGMVRSLRPLSFKIGEEFDIITVSIDPDETPDLAKAKKIEYLKNYGRPGAASGWHFLTGSQEQITRLAEAVGFRYEYDADTDQFIHASGIAVATQTGQLSRYFYGIDYPPKDLRLGLIESADGKIGSPVDQLLLLCYSYDPQTGKYGFVIFTSMRILGIATVLALGVFIFSMLRRDRQRSSATAAL